MTLPILKRDDPLFWEINGGPGVDIKATFAACLHRANESAMFLAATAKSARVAVDKALRDAHFSSLLHEHGWSLTVYALED